jgi:predicted phosphodiesterase
MIKPITRVHRNVHVIELTEKQEFLLISDLHWDNPKCNRDLLKSHLDEALKRNAIIILNGDTLCLMQGRFDPRGTKKDVRPEHNKVNYLDLVIEDCADYLSPYAQNIAVVGYGNHETNIIKRLETDPLQRMVDLINYKTGAGVQAGGYGGWVVAKFQLNGEGGRTSYKIKYFHGSGGGGPVTKNTIGHQRLDAMVNDADMIWVGHTHDLWSMSIEVETLSHLYVPKLKTVTHVQTGTYKDEYNDGYGGWHIERGGPPKSLGGYWLTLEPYRERSEFKDTKRIYATVTKTKG